MWWSHHLTLLMFVIYMYFYSGEDVGVLGAVKSKRSIDMTKIVLGRLSREEGEVRRDYGRGFQARVKIWKETGRTFVLKNLPENTKSGGNRETANLSGVKSERMDKNSSTWPSKTTQTPGDLVTSTISRNNLGENVLSRQKKHQFSEMVCSKYDSCRDRCNNKGRSIDNQKYNCYCDYECYLIYQDCCYDYELYCGKQRYHVNRSRALDRSMVSCIPGYDSKGKNIWMVTKCTAGWLNKETLYKCQNVSTNSILHGQPERIYQHFPVVGVNSIVYRNVFCAQCNNIEDFTYFSLNITCPILPPSSLSSLQEIISFVLKYCRYNDIFFRLYHNQPRRYCGYHLQQNCQVISLSEKCTKGPVAVVTAGQVNFKNKWCAQCHKTLDHELNCGLQISHSVSTYNYGLQLVPCFSIIMDNPEKWRISSVFQTCPTGEIFDPSLQICRRGKLIPPVKDLVDKYHVVMWLQNLFSLKPIVAINNTELLSALVQQFHLNTSQIAHLIIHKMQTYYVVEFQLSLTHFQSLTVSILSTQFGKEHLKQTLSFNDLLHFTLDHERMIELSSDLFKIFKVTSRRLACVGKQSYTNEEYILLKNERYHIMSTNQTFPSKDVYRVGTNITICNDLVSSTCEGLQVHLKPEEYIKFSNLSVYYKSSRALYNIGEYTVENDTTILCTKPSNTTTRVHSERKFDDLAMEILTIFTFTLSLVSLAALIFTYIVFSELRNLPGKNLLNLAIPQFFAQLLWLIGVPVTKWPRFCTIITMTEHYLFLVTFTAMSVIALHTKTTLASKRLKIPLTNMEDRKRFMIYSGFVWGGPLLFVSFTAFLHEYKVYDAGYSYSSTYQRIACWITKRQALELFFILPIGLLVLFNTAMFVYTIIRIHVKKQKSQELYASKNKQHQRKTIWIYLKLSSLTGLTWIFGFLNILADSRLFSVLFVLFASLQGFYIALSFLVNDRVMKRYRELVRRLAQPKRLK